MATQRLRLNPYDEEQSWKAQRLRAWRAALGMVCRAVLRYEMRPIDGQLALVATDIRLGFPGFHPFSFTLATRQADAWTPVATSEELTSQRSVQLTTLSRLAARALGNRDALCATAFVEPKWRYPPQVLPCEPSNND